MKKLWLIQPHDAVLVAKLERQNQIPSVVAQLLAARGVHDDASAQLFLDAKLSGLRDPDLLPGLTQAADVIYRAVCENKKITIYGDYDCDGMTATAILVRCLSLMTSNVNYYVPSRMDEGYGLNSEAIERLGRAGSQMIVTVDCGIASIEDAEKCKELGIDLVITDHHEFADRLPDARAIVHPRLPGSQYPFGRPVRRRRRIQTSMGVMPML